jgi:hypothetical protein
MLCFADILEQTTNHGNTLLQSALFSHADGVTRRFFGDSVYSRGILELSNVCTNDCGYCGIRKHMQGVSSTGTAPALQWGYPTALHKNHPALNQTCQRILQCFSILFEDVDEIV